MMNSRSERRLRYCRAWLFVMSPSWYMRATSRSARPTMVFGNPSVAQKIGVPFIAGSCGYLGQLVPHVGNYAGTRLRKKRVDSPSRAFLYFSDNVGARGGTGRRARLRA